MKVYFIQNGMLKFTIFIANMNHLGRRFRRPVVDNFIILGVFLWLLLHFPRQYV